MTKKSEFMPVVSRIKLNPEQAVLRCDCYSFRFTGDPAFSGVKKNFTETGWFRGQTYGCYLRFHGSTTTKHDNAAICTTPRRNDFGVSNCYGNATGSAGDYSASSS